MTYKLKNNPIVFLILLSLTWILVYPNESGFHREGGRYYAATTADLDGDGQAEIIGVGQVGSEKFGHAGLVTILKVGIDGLTQYGEFTFHVSHEGTKLPTRIRSVCTVRGKDGNRWELYLVGRGGVDDKGVGFLYHAQILKNRILTRGVKLISQRGLKANHGYPLTLADLDNDGTGEIIYGGFFTDKNKDWADVRVFTNKNGTLKENSKPFEKLPIPLRVNAIDAGDIDHDGYYDIVIAGRTRRSDGREFSAVAWWSKGKLNHHIFSKQLQSRLRTVKIVDLGGDHKSELVSGGRIEIGNLWLADLRLWRLENGKLSLIDQFLWSLGNKMRLRTITGVNECLNHIKTGGRVEWLAPTGKLKWKGFVWEFSLENGQLKPIHYPQYFDYAFDIRVRHLYLTETGDIIACGFTKDKKDTGFISIINQNDKK